jgi:hypothetical protein
MDSADNRMYDPFTDDRERIDSMCTGLMYTYRSSFAKISLSASKTINKIKSHFRNLKVRYNYTILNILCNNIFTPPPPEIAV